MAFLKLTTAKATQAACIRGSFSVSKKGKSTFFVSVPSALAGKIWDAFEHADLAIGEGDDAGLIQIFAHANGAFKIGRLKTALVFRVPPQPDWVCGAFDPVALETVSNTEGVLVLHLPKQLFEAPSFNQTKKPSPVPSVPQQWAASPDAGRPRLSIIGTTVELGQQRVKLSMPLFKLFSALWKAWGEPVRGTALQVAMGEDDRDLTKLLVALDRDIEPLKLTVETVQGGYKLLRKA